MILRGADTFGKDLACLIFRLRTVDFFQFTKRRSESSAWRASE